LRRGGNNLQALDLSRLWTGTTRHATRDEISAASHGDEVVLD
jgi:hypothetical protein